MVSIILLLQQLRRMKSFKLRTQCIGTRNSAPIHPDMVPYANDLFLKLLANWDVKTNTR